MESADEKNDYIVYFVYIEIAVRANKLVSPVMYMFGAG